MTNSPSNRATVADDRIYLTNRLQALLKHYSPQALSWAGELGSLQAIDFLARWPRLEAIQKASPEEVRDFYRSHGCRLRAKLPERLAEISAARTADHRPGRPHRFTHNAPGAARTTTRSDRGH